MAQKLHSETFFHCLRDTPINSEISSPYIQERSLQSKERQVADYATSQQGPPCPPLTLKQNVGFKTPNFSWQ